MPEAIIAQPNSPTSTPRTPSEKASSPQPRDGATDVAPTDAKETKSAAGAFLSAYSDGEGDTAPSREAALDDPALSSPLKKVARTGAESVAAEADDAPSVLPRDDSDLVQIDPPLNEKRALTKQQGAPLLVQSNSETATPVIVGVEAPVKDQAQNGPQLSGDTPSTAEPVVPRSQARTPLSVMSTGERAKAVSLKHDIAAAPTPGQMVKATVPTQMVSDAAAPPILGSLPAPTTLPGATTPVGATTLAADPVTIARQVTEAVVATPTPRTLEVRLDPPDLGRIRIDFDFSADGPIKAVIAASESDTLSLLRRNPQLLLDDLARAGLDDVSLDFSEHVPGEEQQPEETHRVAFAADVADAEVAGFISTPSRSTLLLGDTVDIRL